MKKIVKILFLMFLLSVVFSLNCFALSEGDSVSYNGIETTMPKIYLEDDEDYIYEQDPLYVMEEENSIATFSLSSTYDIKSVKDKYEVENETAIGIDVSSFQGSIDWAEVKNAGAKFVIIRCGYRGYAPEGSIAIDQNFKTNIQGALDNGLKVGVYFFSTAITEAEAIQEAAYVVDLVKNYDITYPIYYDFEYFEDKTYTSSTGAETGYRTNGLTTTQLNKNAQAFLGYIKDSGYIPSLYGNKNSLETIWNDTSKSYDVWLAHYTTNLDKSSYEGNYQMWQCTSEGQVVGITGNVDIDIDYSYYYKKIFDDVKYGSWYYEYVEYCYENGLMYGYGSSNKFGPNDNITRGQLITIIYRIEGEPKVNAVSYYTDVTDKNSYYYDAIAWGSENGIITGYPGTGLYKPNNAISREELSVILYRYANYLNIDVSHLSDLNGFDDKDQVSSWALTAVKWLTNVEIITGVNSNGKTYIKPKANATRAEAATMIARYSMNVLDN